jgi:CBS domain-containing protein
MSCVTDETGRLVGIITDGDLRRHMADTPNMLARTSRRR